MNLGIEFGSTRIKAILTDDKGNIIAEGSHTWENELIDSAGKKMWSYSSDAVDTGLQSCYRDLASDYRGKTGKILDSVDSIGISAMMHGYLVFDRNDKLLVPFRTWRNTITEEAADILSREFNFNIPQRWSGAHLYQAILDREEHIGRISFMTTLAGYIHYRLTGRKVLGIGDASGMFPISGKDFDQKMLDRFDELIADAVDWKIRDILPQVLCAGEDAGRLTEEGARYLDPTGALSSGSITCPPEGDAGTGMTATDSIRVRTGNVSAGTSIFAMVVMEKPLSRVYKEIDVVTTPDGSPVAMVHCNNCTSEINAWAGLLKDFADRIGADVDMSKIYEVFFMSAPEGDKDCDGVISFNYFAGEPVTDISEGRPLIVRNPDSKLSFANFTRSHLMSAAATLKIGMDILASEGVTVDTMYGHGGYFKTPEVGQKIMAAALDSPVTVMETAGEGGAWGIAILALYAKTVSNGLRMSLGDFLDGVVFEGAKGTSCSPDADDVKGYADYMEKYIAALDIEREAIRALTL